MFVASIEVLVKWPWYTEGPVTDADGNIYFTTLKGKEILKIGQDGKIRPWARAECPNGQIILDGGDHLVCDSGGLSLNRYNPNGKLIQHLVKGQCAGVSLRCPNDLVTDDEGTIYFTDSVRDQGRLFRLAPDGNQEIIASGPDFPNGIAISKDGSKLWVAESYRNRILSFDRRNGYTKTVLVNLPVNPTGNPLGNLPDGIKTDKSGNLWVAHYGMSALQVLSSEGKLTHTMQIDFPLVSNLAFIEDSVVITGGYGEPGPGAVLQRSAVLSQITPIL